MQWYSTVGDEETMWEVLIGRWGGEPEEGGRGGGIEDEGEKRKKGTGWWEVKE